MVLIGLQFLESLYISLMTVHKCCVFGYTKQEIKTNVFDFDDYYDKSILEGKNVFREGGYVEGEVISEKVRDIILKNE